MKYHALFVIFEKAEKNCRLLQIIGGALRVKIANTFLFLSSTKMLVIRAAISQNDY